MSTARIWVWFCAYLNCAGWILSAIHELNATGYAIILSAFLLTAIIWRPKTSRQILPRFRWRKLYNLFRKPFPLVFLVLSTMVFLVVGIYSQSNYDALAYRIPRVVHWFVLVVWHLFIAF